MTRSRAAAALLGAALLTGCAATAADPPAAAPTSSATSSPSSTSSAPPPADHIENATPFPSTAPDGARTAADLSLAAMTAFVDHSLDADRWFTYLAPYLSPQAREAWAYTDPAEIPARQIVGAPTVLSEGPYLAETQQATDAGVYALLLSRADDGQWQVEQITPPETVPVGS